MGQGDSHEFHEISERLRGRVLRKVPQSVAITFPGRVQFVRTTCWGVPTDWTCRFSLGDLQMRRRATCPMTLTRIRERQTP